MNRKNGRYFIFGKFKNGEQNTKEERIFDFGFWILDFGMAA
jgi:hypothetical protein